MTREQKGHERKFEEIIVEYPPAELCTYPEYRGKPYFSIKYEENGEHIVGFGTYKPEVLSKYLREYFIAPAIIEEDKEEQLKNLKVLKADFDYAKFRCALSQAESEDKVPNKEEEDDCTDIYCENCRNNYNCIEYLEEQERMNEEDDE